MLEGFPYQLHQKPNWSFMKIISLQLITLLTICEEDYWNHLMLPPYEDGNYPMLASTTSIIMPSEFNDHPYAFLSYYLNQHSEDHGL
jgi:hypothetical protein